MTSSPTLHKTFATVEGRSMALYYTREGDIEIKFAKCAHTGRELRLDEQEQDEAIIQIEETI